MNKHNVKISIIIPCFNEKNTLIELINKVVLSLNNYKYKNYEIILFMLLKSPSVLM